MNPEDPTTTTPPPVSPLARFGHALALSPRAFTPPIGVAGWLVPLLIVIVAQVGAVLSVQELLMERWQEQAVEQIEGNENLSPEDRAEALQALEDGPLRQIAQVMNLVAPIFVPVLGALLAALVLLAIVNFGMGGHARFAALWPVAAIAWSPKAIEAILYAFLAKARGSAEIYFGPAALLPDDGSLLRSLLSVFDLFQLWMLGIHVVGLSLVAGIPPGRGRSAALVLWIGFWVIGLVFAFIGHKLGGGA
ncbi:MAG: hypothetical protein GF346_13335 [Candidatus Eisenbacteria bacterium]|nr:hypothetical protein [Candidatus Latescibacterota bacterium]MBD3303423.1 hypothetical protein [Candidatus Eisenbacteria bacterium]